MQATVSRSGPGGLTGRPWSPGAGRFFCALFLKFAEETHGLQRVLCYLEQRCCGLEELPWEDLVKR